MSDHRPNPLTTWAEIASYLGVSIRTAQTYERTQALPVHRMAGEKSRVYTYAEDLDRWRKQTENADGLAAHSSPDGPTVAEVTLGGLPGKPKIHKVWLFSLSISALVVTAVAMLLGTHRATIVDFRVDGPTLVAISSNGREPWRYQFSSPLINSAYEGDRKYVVSWMGALPDRQDWALLLASNSVDRGDVGDTLYCFDRRGKVRWRFTPGRTVADRSGSLMVPPYFICSVRVFPGKRAADTRIAVSSVHHLEQPAQIAILDATGHAIAEYWHPGHLNHMEFFDLASDGHPQLLLGGVNNGHHQATLVVLDLAHLPKIATTGPSPDARFDLVGLPVIREKAVVFFPRSCVSYDQPYTRVAGLHVTKERIFVEIAEGTNQESSPHIVYELDFGLHVRTVSGTDSYRERHDQLQLSGILRHALAASEFQNLGNEVIVKESLQFAKATNPSATSSPAVTLKESVSAAN